MTQSLPVSLRHATLADVDRIVAIHATAFHHTFMAAFGKKRYHDGLRVMADVWRRQGMMGLYGMWVAEYEGVVVGTITMRARMPQWLPPSIPVEWLFVRALGVVRGLYALQALSFIEHHIGANELYVTDVAVDQRYQRQGVARAMLHHALHHAARQQLEVVSLYVDAANKPALGLYQGSGFYVAHTHHSLMGWWLLGQPRWLLLRRMVVPVPQRDQLPIEGAQYSE